MKPILFLSYFAATGPCLAAFELPHRALPQHNITATSQRYIAPSDDEPAWQASSFARRRSLNEDAGVHARNGTSPALRWLSELPREDMDSDDALLRAIDWKRTLNIAVKTVSRTTAVYGLQLEIKNLVRDCRKYASGENDPETSENCVGGAIVRAIATALSFNKIVEYVGQFVDDIKWAFFEANMHRLTPWAGRVVASMGTYLSPNARRLLESRADKVRRAESALSAQIGMDIRHIGFLDQSTPAANQHLGVREGSAPVPVFAVLHDGQHMHFAAAKDPATGETKVRTGFGPGAETEANVAGLHARGSKRPEFNQQYFDKGGLDLVGRTDSLLGQDDGGDSQPATPSPELYNALYDALACYLGFDGAGGLSDAPGFWYQIYDSQSRGTVAAGAMAVFDGDDGRSIIPWLRPEGGLDVRDDCAALSHDEL